MVKKIFIIAFIVVSCISFSGCQSYSRQIAAAENIIDELERVNGERAAEHAKLEQLYNIERTGNQALATLNDQIQGELNNYTESERRRIEAEREIIENLAGIFGNGQDIINQLIEGYEEIRRYILSLEEVE